MDLVSALRARTGLALLLAAVTLAGPLTPAAAAAPGTGGRHRAVGTAAPVAPAGAASAARRTGSAWLPYWGDTDAAYRDAVRHAGQLHTVSPFWYEASATEVKGQEGAGRRDIIDGLHRAGLAVVPTVTETLDAAAMAELTHDPRRRAAHLDALLATVRSRPYDGIDLDYETMAVTGDEATRERVRTGYDTLTTELCARLHADGRQCVVTVPPRARGTAAAFDYPHLGEVADTVRIMGYDLHWSGGPPGPLAATGWYEEFLRYATATVPREKIEVAFPGYGWDWVKGSTARATHVTWREAEALREREGAERLFDTASGTPHFGYRRDGADHEVWYQNARGVAAHLPLLRKYGVRGTGLWALGFEDPDMWAVLRGE
ncbi:glycosyl hydrolase family 18 protein [Streptomyces celluloflavus]|uniref:Glycosyl hydrolase family 18 protein n=1 Tax=Streptomyces celluloflavus TaxID=58344 RepID=A0ABW7R6W0_9ACTN|nr:glycosyl hydrolase family 18 protein [Streptomyces celluloflavus]